MRRMLALGAALLLMGCGADDTTEADDDTEATVLSAAYDTCLLDAQNSLSSGGYGDDAPEAESILMIEDAGQRLSVVTPEPGGELMASEAFGATECVLEQTGAPSSVGQKMGAATALSGPASDSWDEVEVEWSYAAGADAAGFQAFFKMAD